MSRVSFYFSLLVFLMVTIPAVCGDKQKAQSQLNKVNAMAMDPSGKRAVNLASAETLSTERVELVQRRREMNISYGDLFVAYQLAKSGAKLDDIAAGIKTGKTVWQIADEGHADWREITAASRKLNSRIDASLLKHFANQKTDAERDQAERYDPFSDNVRADAAVSRQDMEDAQKRFVFLRDHAGVTSDAKLDTSTERSARMVRTDPVRTGGPNDPDTSTRPGPR